MVVLVTGAGAPGFIGTFKSLVHNYDNRQIDIIATDMYDDVIGKYYAKKFYQIPPAIDDDYLDRIKEIYYKEKVDVLLPQNTMELSKLVGSGMNVCVSNNVSLANNKAILYDTAREIGVPIPNYVRMKGKVVVKPVVGHGSKGLHIIDGEDSLVSEYLEGDEYTVDCFRGNRFVAIPRLRKKVVNGITWDAQVVIF
jgi:predicted ATP-grasp superfamily ATP-dependent carboligase